MGRELDVSLFFYEEQEECARMTPGQRYRANCDLWSTYLAFGGSFDPEPDSQSPFDFPEFWQKKSMIEPQRTYITEDTEWKKIN